MLSSQLPRPPSVINLQTVIVIAGILSPLLTNPQMNPGVTGVEWTYVEASLSFLSSFITVLTTVSRQHYIENC